MTIGIIGFVVGCLAVVTAWQFEKVTMELEQVKKELANDRNWRRHLQDRFNYHLCCHNSAGQESWKGVDIEEETKEEE